MTTKRKAEKKATSNRIGKRVIIMITDSEDCGTPLVDDWVYLDQERRVREFVKTLGPLPRQMKRIVRLEHTDYEVQPS